MSVESTLEQSASRRIYTIKGQIFFASADDLRRSFNLNEALKEVIIDLSSAHFWDITAVSTLDKIIIKLRNSGSDVKILGMSEACATVINRFSVHDKPEEARKLLASH